MTGFSEVVPVLMRGVAGVVLAAVALTAGAADGVKQLRDFVAGVRSAEGDFEQVVTAQSGRRPQEAAGSFAYARPGRFHWEYARPYRQVLVGDGKVLSAAVLDEREILLIANAAGDTMLQVWTRDGRSHRVKVTVRQHDMDRLARDLHDFLGSIPNVRSRTLGDHLVIEGENISDADRDRIAEIVKRFPQVIDFTSRVGFDRMFAFDVHFVEISRSGLEDLGIDWSSQGKPLLGLDIVGDLYHNNRTGEALSRMLEDGDARTEVRASTVSACGRSRAASASSARSSGGSTCWPRRATR